MLGGLSCNSTKKRRREEEKFNHKSLRNSVHVIVICCLIVSEAEERAKSVCDIYLADIRDHCRCRWDPARTSPRKPDQVPKCPIDKSLVWLVCCLIEFRVWFVCERDVGAREIEKKINT